MTLYDYLFVGFRLFGITFAYRPKPTGKVCLLIDKYSSWVVILLRREGMAYPSCLQARLMSIMDSASGNCMIGEV